LNPAPAPVELPFRSLHFCFFAVESDRSWQEVPRNHVSPQELATASTQTQKSGSLEKKFEQTGRMAYLITWSEKISLFV